MITLNSVVFFTLSNMAFCKYGASILLARDRTCSLVLSVVSLMIVRSFIISAVNCVVVNSS